MRCEWLLVLAVLVGGCCCRRACPTPRATSPVEVVAPAPAEEEFPRVRVLIAPNGDFVARTGDGEGDLLAEGSLRSDSAKADLDRLRQALIELTAPEKWREPDGSSMVAVVVESPKSTKWREVQHIMQVFAHPDLRIYKMQFQFRDPGP